VTAMELGEHKRVRRPADRDLALQLVAVRALASKVPLITSAAPVRVVDTSGHERNCVQTDRSVLGRDRGDGSPPAHAQPLYRVEELAERLATVRQHRQDAREGLVQALERAERTGPMRRLGMPGSSLAFEQLRNEYPHFAEVLDFVWKRVLLARSVDGAAFRLPPTLLNGPPGCGKTAFAERLATWLGVPIARLDMPSMNASFSITGLEGGFSTGKPGVLWEVLQGECLSPVLLLDELDKARALNADAGSTFLLSLLEPVTACRFQDRFVGLSIDASHVQWLATSNDLSAIDAPLRSRLRVFEVRQPKRDECVHVVRSVYRALRKREPWAGAFPADLPLAVLDALLDRTARESWQALEDACAAAVADGRRELRVDDIPANRSRPKKSIGFIPTNDTGEHCAY
jgi:ATP-dependent Lon protease